jgi:hypothetical protein
LQVHDVVCISAKIQDRRFFLVRIGPGTGFSLLDAVADASMCQGNRWGRRMRRVRTHMRRFSNLKQ